MLSIDKIHWLKKNLTLDFIEELWIFGSSTQDVEFYNDIDVYIRYSDGHSRQVVDLRRVLEEKFSCTFGENLHFLALTKEECEESFIFLDAALRTGVKIF